MKCRVPTDGRPANSGLSDETETMGGEGGRAGAHGAVAAVALSVLSIGSVDCARRDPHEGLTGGRLVFSDDFEGSGISQHWRTTSDRYRIDGGALSVEGARNEALWLQFPLPERVRVEFTARSGAADGDIKFEVFGDGERHQSGYIGIFGGWQNQINTIARLDEHGEDRIEGQIGIHVQQGRDYRMAVVRTDDRVRWFVDGSLFLTFPDGAPLRGEAHDHFGFNDWTVPLRFDEVRVYDLSESR